RPPASSAARQHCLSPYVSPVAVTPHERSTSMRLCTFPRPAIRYPSVYSTTAQTKNISAALRPGDATPCASIMRGIAHRNMLPYSRIWAAAQPEDSNRQENYHEEHHAIIPRCDGYVAVAVHDCRGTGTAERHDLFHHQRWLRQGSGSGWPGGG